MIPDFLKPENKPKYNDKMMDMIEKYIDHFGEDITTECSSFTEDEWVRILQHCIETNKPLESFIDQEDDEVLI